nr:CPBP family intramembrane glutamic endopeptidase [Clostridium cavendishii]
MFIYSYSKVDNSINDGKVTFEQILLVILFFPFTIFIAPIVEEYIFRGLIISRAKTQKGVKISVIISTAVFLYYTFRKG